MTQKMRLLFTGDLLPADREHTPGIGAGSKLSRGEGLWAGDVKSLLLSADATVVNLEAPLVNDPEKQAKKSFEGKKEILQVFKENSITHAHIANNHILEHGEENWHNTITLLKDKGIEPVGIQTGNTSNIVTKTHNGLTVATAGFNAVHDIANPGLYAELTEEAVLKVLDDEALQKADVRVLLFHWGNEYIHIPSWQQMQLARKCIDRGAHLVIGHHPHVVQPVEEYSRGLICYSLGNFVFDMLWNKSVRTGLVMEIEVNKQGIASWKVHGVRYNSKLQTGLLQTHWLEKKLLQWQSKMKRLEAKGEAAYNKAYYRELKINRFLARLQMKKQLIMQLPCMSSANRKEVIKSLFSKIKGTNSYL